LVVSFAGAVVGIGLAMICLPLLVHLIPAEWSPTESDLVRVDHNAIIVSCAIAALMGILFGIAPALQVSQLDFVESLKEGGAKGSASRQPRLVRTGLIAVELALSLVVLAAAALMVRSYRNLQHIDLGFRSDHLLSFQISLPESKYPRGDQRAAFFSRAVQELRSAPAVEGSATVSGRPVAERTVDLTSRDFTIEGQPTEDARPSNADFRVVSPGYLETIGARILQGRSFSDQDGAGAPLAAIINETMAKMFWPAGDAVGHRIRLGRQYARPDTFASPDNFDRALPIVGIAPDVRQIRAIDAPLPPEFYMPLAQQANPPRTMTLVLRSTLDPATVTNSARAAIRAVDSEQPIYDIS